MWADKEIFVFFEIPCGPSMRDFPETSENRPQRFPDNRSLAYHTVHCLGYVGSAVCIRNNLQVCTYLEKKVNLVINAFLKYKSFSHMA